MPSTDSVTVCESAVFTPADMFTTTFVPLMMPGVDIVISNSLVLEKSSPRKSLPERVGFTMSFLCQLDTTPFERHSLTEARLLSLVSTVSISRASKSSLSVRK